MAKSKEDDKSLFETRYCCKQCGYMLSEAQATHLRIDIECPECGCQLFRPHAFKKPKQV